MAANASRDRAGRLVTCEGCGHVFPQAEVRRFRALDGARSSVCMRCACVAMDTGRVEDDPTNRVRLLELITAALCNPTWGETAASRAQRVRCRTRPTLSRLMRVLSAGGGE